MERKEKIEPCAYCGNQPTIVRLPSDLFYAQCPHNNKATNRVQGLYDYLGITRKLCIATWNKAQQSLLKYLTANKTKKDMK